MSLFKKASGQAKNTSKTGKTGEDVACLFLERKGYRILDRNYKQSSGEIDIIGFKDGSVRFIEVKALSRENIGHETHTVEEYRPEEQVHEKKLLKIARTAEAYMASRKDGRDYQIDVVGIVFDIAARKARCRLFEQVY